jgi:endonuclease YncB( thermonuclease family)
VKRLPFSALAAILLCIAPAHADISGKPQIIDGDTIDIGGQRIRLHGMAAPESVQACEANGKSWRCGQDATRALANIIGRTWVTRQERDRGLYGRITIAVLDELMPWHYAEALA